MSTRKLRKTALAVAVVAVSFTAATPALANRSVANHTAGGVSDAFAANNKVWITDTGQEGLDNNPGQNGLYEYDAYPSQTLLEVPNTFSVWSYYILDLQAAVDQENGEVFVAQSNGRTIDIFAEEKGKYAYSHSWTAINGDGTCFSCTPIIHVAIDNSHTSSRGRVYLSLTSPEDDVEAFDAAERPVDFPATATYISNNKLTGTPSGSFGEVGHVAVDNIGNIYVTDVEKQVIDEFDSTGTFVRTLPCEGCGNGYPVGSGGVGVDPTNGNIIVGTGGRLNEYDSSGNQLDAIEDGGQPAVNSEGYLYSSSGTIYSPTPVVAAVTNKPLSSPTTTSGTLNASVDPNAGGDVTECQFEYAEQGAFNASAATNAVQSLTISGATGGEFTLGFNGQTTPVLSYEASAGSVQSALEGMSTIGPNNVSVSGSSGGPYKVEFVGRLARTAMPLLTVDSSALSPPSATASVKATAKGGRWEGATEVPCLNEGNEEVDTHPIPSAGPPAEVHGAISGLAAGKTYEYRVAVRSADGSKYGAAQTYTTGKVPGLTTDPATNLTENSVTLNASFVGDEGDTHYYFEWGSTTEYGHTSAAPPGVDAGSPSGPSRTPISTELTGLEPYSTYHYRVIATNGSGTSQGQDQYFTTTPGMPTTQSPAVTVVHSDRAIFHGEVDPNGTPTKARFEYVDDANFQQSGWANALTTTEAEIGMSKHYQSVSQSVTGLMPDTLYHYRVVGTNEMGSGNSVATFRTFAFIPSFNDPCPNAHVRQQTGASLLLDCRAYELVSAANAGGYDVESNLVPGQTPFGGYPDAENPSQVLYGVHDGGIPGTGHPTNNGVDPYVATRGEEGWSTKYVGIPANDPNTSGSFASTLLEADASLDTFAFGGREICSPCFADGSTGNPIHLPNGELVQGETGSLSEPAAEPAGFIGKHLSADGTHFIFGSKAKLEPDANNNGDVNVYDRDLTKGETHLVSKTPGGQTMSGAGIGELDVSKDGSRVLLGQLVSEEGNSRYWHLYMNIEDSEKTVDLTPGTTSGVLFDGMTEDGSKVFFTTVDRLLPAQDTDHSADIYEAEVDSQGNATLSLISTGSEGAGNSDSCDPAANTIREHWNTTGSEENCGAVAIGGGAGVAAGDGTIYFLSPEKLDGSSNGIQNAPNLYVARPGQPPHFIATLESSASAPLPMPTHPFLREFGAFSNPAGVAIEHSTGDFYVLDIETTEGTGYVYKFDQSGHPVVTFGSGGALTVSGMWGLENVPTELAVNQSNGDLYVPFARNGVVKEYDSSGNAVGQISTSFPTGVAVDQANERVYVSSLFGEIIVYEPNGTQVNSFPTGFSFPTGPTSVAVDSTGKVYVSNGGGLARAKGITKIFNSSGTQLGLLTEAPSKGLAVDPSNNHVYVDEGGKVVEFDSSGNQVNAPTGAGLLSGSIGLAVDSGTIGVSNPGQANIATFGPAVVPRDPSTDNPVVVDSVSFAGTPNTADFQVSPSGNYAVFPSTLPLTGYNNAANPEIFRYDASAEEIACASCNPTSEEATGEATLASDGLSLTDDGRVFFNSTEGLVDSDLNGKMDVYEWSPQRPASEVGACHTEGGCVELISAGTSPFDSSLLGVSSDGTDAYFFTRDTLVTSDENGTRVKIYDARVNGGFPEVPPPHECQASDECHGAGSQAPPQPSVKTVAGTPVGNATAPAKCKKGQVKKQGKCVKKHRPKRHHKAHRKAHHHG